MIAPFLDKNLKEYFNFDSVSQQLRVDCKRNEKMLAPYTDSNGNFNGRKYFDDFFEAVYETVNKYQQDKSALPQSCEQR